MWNDLEIFAFSHLFIWHKSTARKSFGERLFLDCYRVALKKRKSAMIDTIEQREGHIATANVCLIITREPTWGGENSSNIQILMKNKVDDIKIIAKNSIPQTNMSCQSSIYSWQIWRSEIVHLIISLIIVKEGWNHHRAIVKLPLKRKYAST